MLSGGPKHLFLWEYMVSPGGSAVKNPPASAGALGSVPGPGRYPGEGNGNPVHYSCLGNPMDKGARWATKLQRVRHDLAAKQPQLQHGGEEFWS